MKICFWAKSAVKFFAMVKDFPKIWSKLGGMQFLPISQLFMFSFNFDDMFLKYFFLRRVKQDVAVIMLRSCVVVYLCDGTFLRQHFLRM